MIRRLITVRPLAARTWQPAFSAINQLRGYRKYRYSPRSAREHRNELFNNDVKPITPYQNYNTTKWSENNSQNYNQESEKERDRRIYEKYGRLGFFYVYRRPLTWTVGGLGLIYAFNLERAPVSGRIRVMLVPSWLEIYIGDQSYAQTVQELKSHILPSSHPKTRMVKQIMDRLIAVSGLENLDWKVHVVSGPFPPNAFVMPGGKVFVFDTLLPVCQNIDGLATVLSHETAHQVCRHSAESLSKTPIWWLVNTAVYVATGIYMSNNPVTNLVFELPASREMEREADNVGLKMMAKACFNPNEAVNLWRRMMSMEKQQGANVPELLSTHPASEKRIELIKKELPEVNQIRSENCSQMSQFRGMMKW